MSTTLPTDEQRQLSDRLLLAQLRAAEQAARWEPMRAIALLALSIGAFLIAVFIAVWMLSERGAQQMTVSFDRPLQVRIIQ